METAACRINTSVLHGSWRFARQNSGFCTIPDQTGNFIGELCGGASIGGEVQGALPGIEPLIGKASFQAVRGAQTGGNILLYPPGEGFIAGIQGDAQDSGLLIQTVQQGDDLVQYGAIGALFQR